jgi:hypothetical protein
MADNEMPEEEKADGTENPGIEPEGDQTGSEDSSFVGADDA